MDHEADYIELESRLAKAEAAAEQAKYTQTKAQEFGERMRAERDDAEKRLDAIAQALFERQAKREAFAAGYVDAWGEQ